LGWTSAGRLAIGHRADLVAIRLDSERTAGISGELAIEAAIFAATTADISTVVVDGETVVADHRHLRIDVRAELHASIAELVT
jgi:cytosine/adenosine deaminase-related metal-dependent hydrolase